MQKALFGFFMGALLLLSHQATASQNTPPPLPVVDKQLQQAQADFEIAKKMFNPWYAGPLLTPSAHNAPPGTFLIQPYLFFTNTYAQYNGSRKSVNTPDLWTFNQSMILQTGILSWLDITLTPQGIYNTQKGQDSYYWGDTSLQLGFQILKEQPYLPAIRFTLSESFPTGRYEKLNPKKNGVDATGSGAYTTNFSLNTSKVFWWVLDHPFAWRLSVNYALSAPTNVEGFNVYGGTYDTSGKVRPGNKLAVDTSIELSFTQKWVLAIDLVYTYQNASSFSGKKGTLPSGALASVGAPSNDNLSCAPAIEYNPSDHLGFLAGVWFTVTGRNSGSFVSGVLSMYYVW